MIIFLYIALAEAVIIYGLLASDRFRDMVRSIAREIGKFLKGMRRGKKA